MHSSDNSQAHKLMLALHRLRRLDMNKMAPLTFKPSEFRLMYSILQGLEQEPRGITVSELSTRMGVASPTVTPQIRSLEEQGLVHRYNDQEDRRVVRVKLTEQGEQAFRTAAEHRSKQIQNLCDFLGEEKSNQLIELLHDVHRYFESQINQNKKTE
ncbi:MarR family transcriptional regulator [Paenibacillus macerans]|uniref:MarR family winged helix-turn-helix transcriptional regulator n=1 Tax=Paenibacillus macerans TaxID=44252 RepID=UPI00203D6CAE|nr:MarR family transcriptional regulator [Paenibacillus macerans]MCM3700900.1 MarR family transcriptional regulator [Paenibacillus macerans]